MISVPLGEYDADDYLKDWKQKIEHDLHVAVCGGAPYYDTFSEDLIQVFGALTRKHQHSRDPNEQGNEESTAMTFFREEIEKHKARVKRHGETPTIG